MTTTTASIPRRSPLATLARTELKLFAREPIALFWGVVFPLILLVVLGTATGDKHQKSLGGLRFIDTYTPVLMVFVLSILALNALPAVLASYRDKGYLRRLRTTPIGPARLLGVQFAIAIAISALSMALITIVAKVAFNVAIPSQFGGFVLALALGAVAMLGLGTLIAAVSPSQRLAGLIGSLLFFPMMFFAGLWGPQASMSAGLRHVSEFTPLGAAVAAVGDAMRGNFPHLAHIAVLAGYGVVFALVAVRLFRWER